MEIIFIYFSILWIDCPFGESLYDGVRQSTRGCNRLLQIWETPSGDIMWLEDNDNLCSTSKGKNSFRIID